MGKDIIAISVGGSLIVPDKISVEFLKEFRSCISKQIERGRRFAIICGGGRTAREYDMLLI